MKIFVTGASGFIGSAIAAELIKAGHSVVGLARNDASAAKVKVLGATPHTGDVENHASLKAAAGQCDGVVHCGFVHEFHRFAEVCAIDARAIGAIGEALAGTQKPFLIASGVALATGGGVATEDTRATNQHNPRIATENAADELAAKGIRVGLMRFSPTVHGPNDHGFIKMLIDNAKQKGSVGYVGDGANRWPAVNRLDAGVLGALAIASPFKPGQRFHFVAEEGVPFKQIAEAIAKGTGLPVKSVTQEQAGEQFGWFAHFAGLDAPASSAKTRELTGWKPTHTDLLPDIAASYF